MANSSGPGGFGKTAAHRVVAAACESAGLNADNAELIRLGENALFRLPDHQVVVRIARTMNYWDDAMKEVQVARWLAEQDLPAAEVVDMPQPIAVMGHPVTFWRFIPGHPGGPQDIGTLGRVLRTLHAMPRPATFELPSEDILGRVASRVETATVSSNDKEFLLHRLQELHSEVSNLNYPLQLAPTHGDAHTENLMILNGNAILIDFERFAWGQPEWDLAMTATEYVTADWWTKAEYERFVSAYGFDVTSWEGFPVLRAVHELKMTTWLMQNVCESPEIAAEYQVRMKTIRDGQHVPWRAF